jgi:hypothetical protein
VFSRPQDVDTAKVAATRAAEGYKSISGKSVSSTIEGTLSSDLYVSLFLVVSPIIDFLHRPIHS